MDYQDYYKTLGVARNADEKAVKQAYRKLARQYHPDKHQGDKANEEKFKEINEAYEVLGDAEKRAKYDQFGSAWQRYQQQPGGGRGAPGGQGAPGDFNWDSWRPEPGVQYTYASSDDVGDLFGGGGFSSFFETLFGQPGMGGAGRGGTAGAGQGSRSRMGTGGAGRARRGQDYEHPLEVTLQEAFTGTERLLNKDGERLTVRIPPGVKTGSKVRVRGGGTPGAGGGPSGDLYLMVEVQPDPHFERHGDDLATTVDVPLYTCVLGGAVRVKTPAGDVHLTVRPETQNGRRMRLSGQGMPRLKKPEERGDLYVTVHVKLPTGLSEQERELFEELKALREEGEGKVPG